MAINIEHHAPNEDADYYTHSGPTAPSPGVPTPWAVITISASLLVSVAVGAFFLGGVSKQVDDDSKASVTRFVQVEKRMDDFTKEMRDILHTNQQTDVDITKALSDLSSQVRVLNSQMDVLVRHYTGPQTGTMK